MHKQYSLSTPYKGFTIIEVMVVLAVSSLILLVLFVAVPQAQQQSRNAQRKRDVDRFFVALLEYSRFNQGRLPGYSNNIIFNYDSEGELVQKGSGIGARAKATHCIVRDRVLPRIVTEEVEDQGACVPSFDKASIQGFNDPLTGEPYGVSYGNSLGHVGDIDWFTGVRCVGDSWAPIQEAETGSQTDVAILTALEPDNRRMEGSLEVHTGPYYCIDNVFSP